MANNITLQLKGGTADEWILRNPVLKEREIGLILDNLSATIGFKVGDGKTSWKKLNEFIPGKTLISELSTQIYNQLYSVDRINNTLSSKINSEITRATTAESQLSSSINTLLLDNGLDTNNHILITANGNSEYVVSISESSLGIGRDINIANNNISAIVIGNSSGVSRTASGSIAIGNRALAAATDAIQLGTGTNNSRNSLQFKDQPIIVTRNNTKYIDNALLERSVESLSGTVNITTADAISAVSSTYATYAENVSQTVIESIANIIKANVDDLVFTDNNNNVSIGKNTTTGANNNIILGNNSKIEGRAYRNIVIGESGVVANDISGSIQLGTGRTKTDNTLQYYICPIVTARNIADIKTYKLNKDLLTNSLNGLSVPNLSASYAESSYYAISAQNAEKLGGQSLTDILTRPVSYYNATSSNVTELGTGLRNENTNTIKNNITNVVNIGNNNIDTTSSIVIGQNSYSNSSGSIAIGISANTEAINSIQLGTGTNNRLNSLKFNDCLIAYKENGKYRIEPVLIKNSLDKLDISINSISSNIISTDKLSANNAYITNSFNTNIETSTAKIGNISIYNNVLSSSASDGIKIKGGNVTVPGYEGAYTTPANDTVMRFADVKWYLEKEGINLAKDALYLPQNPSIIIGKNATAAPYNVVIAPYGRVLKSENSILIGSASSNDFERSGDILSCDYVIQLGKSNPITNRKGVLRVYDTDILEAPINAINSPVISKFRLSKSVLQNIPENYISAFDVNLTTVSAKNAITLGGKTNEEIHNAVTADIPLRYNGQSIALGTTNDITEDTNIITIGDNNSLSCSDSIVIGSNITNNGDNSIVINASNITNNNDNNVLINFITPSTEVTATNAVVINSNNSYNDIIKNNDIIINNTKLVYEDEGIKYFNKDLVSASQVHYPLTAEIVREDVTTPSEDDPNTDITESLIVLESLRAGKEITVNPSTNINDDIIIGNNIVVENYTTNQTEENIEDYEEIVTHPIVLIGNNITTDTSEIVGPTVQLGGGTYELNTINFKIFNNNVIDNGIISENIFEKTVENYLGLSKSNDIWTGNKIIPDCAVSAASSNIANTANSATIANVATILSGNDNPYTINLNGAISSTTEIYGQSSIVINTTLNSELCSTIDSLITDVNNINEIVNKQDGLILHGTGNITTSDDHGDILGIYSGIIGDNQKAGAHLELYRSSYNEGEALPGQFSLIAVGENTTSELIGSSDSLTWCNKPLITSINNISAETNGNINLSEVLSSTYAVSAIYTGATVSAISSTYSENAVLAKTANVAIGLSPDAQESIIESRIKVYPPVGDDTNSFIAGYIPANTGAYTNNNIIITTYKDNSNVDTALHDISGSILLTNNELSADLPNDSFIINNTPVIIDLNNTPKLNPELIQKDPFYITSAKTILGSANNIKDLSESILITNAKSDNYTISAASSVLIGNSIGSNNDNSNSLTESIVIGNGLTTTGVVNNSVIIASDTEIPETQNAVRLGNPGVKSLYVGDTKILDNGKLNTELINDIIITGERDDSNRISCIKSLNIGNYHIQLGKLKIPTGTTNPQIFYMENLFVDPSIYDSNIKYNIQLTPYTNTNISYTINATSISFVNTGLDDITVDYSIQWFDPIDI